MRIFVRVIAFISLMSPVFGEEQAQALRKKSDAGDLSATVELAHLSLRSKSGVEYNPGFIFASFEKGAQAGSARAHYGLAKCYVQGIGTKSDPKLALKHAQASADKGDAQGIRYLGNCYLYGRGMDEPDPEKGISLLKKSIAMGNEMAEYTYAYYLTRNLKDRGSNEEGLRIAQSLVERKHPDGLHLVGTLYHDGVGGLPRDREQAMKHYRLAAGQNLAGGLHEVGNMLFQDKKPQEAIGWLVKAINRGSRNAPWPLSQIMKADPDLQEHPLQWVGFAETGADAGNKWAQEAVANFYYMEGPEEKRDWIKASKYALKAAGQGRCRCWDWLAFMRIHGKHGLEKNPKLALTYCENHFEHGYHSASNAGHILLNEDVFNKTRAHRIKGYAALLSANKKGAKFDQKYLKARANGAGMNATEIKEATALSQTGFPKPGDKMLE